LLVFRATTYQPVGMSPADVLVVKGKLSVAVKIFA